MVICGCADAVSMKVADVCRVRDGCVEVDVSVSPRSNRSGPDGYDEWRRRMNVRVKAPPLDGRANKEVAELFRDMTGCRAEVTSGLMTRPPSCPPSEVRSTDDAERLEAIQELLDELSSMSSTHIILVEGLKDVASLRHVGVDGEFFCVQSGGGPVKAAEHVWHSGKQAVIMTDWDRRGGTLARSLRENLQALDVRYDDRIRGELAVLCRPYVKDVESVDAVVLLLQRSVGQAP